MKKKALAVILICLAAGISELEAATYLKPDPVTLPIDNIEQESDYWCWAAIVQQLLQRPTYGQPPRQCELVNQANLDRGQAADDCCLRPEGAACGDRLGDLSEIVGLIGRYTVRVEPRPGPETPESLYRTLLAGQAVLAGFEISEGLNHLYLIRGLFWDDEGRPQLLVNDPVRPGATTLDFESARHSWLVTLTIY